MFTTFPALPFASKAPRWAKRVASRYPLLFGLSPFAHLFACSADSSRFAVVVTERPELVELNSLNMDAFISEFLDNERVRQEFFRQGDSQLLAERLGPLAQDECFYPVPYPAMGGSGALETYERGDAWIHLEIYGQTIGL